MATPHTYTRVRDLDRWGYGQQADELIALAAEIGHQLALWNGDTIFVLERQVRRRLRKLTNELEAKGLPWHPAVARLKKRCEQTMIAVQMAAIDDPSDEDDAP